MTNLLTSSKQQLRSYLRSVRRNITSQEQKKKSRIITKHICQTSVFKKARVIAAYLSFGREVLMDELIEQAWDKGKTVLIPDTKKGLGSPVLVPYFMKDSLTVTKFGPEELSFWRPAFPVKEIDLVLAPGLGFDRYGRRLGYGAGVYDQYIVKTSQAHHFGVFFSEQEVSAVPTTFHDQSVDSVVTEKGLFKCLI